MQRGKGDKNLDNIRHSLAHILAAAVLEKFPETKLGIGPVIESGFYYDFQFNKPISEDILPELEKVMRRIIKEKLPFRGKKLTPAEARKIFKDQPFKLELIKDFVKDKKPLTAYKTGDIFNDLCRGGHVKNTQEISPDAFKLTHLAGAYWRGDEKNPQLIRIYGAAFAAKKELEKYLWQQEEAKKRDHKKLGQELDLFVFSNLVGGGLPLFTPRGTVVREELEQFVQSLQVPAGYQRVRIPHITKKELYKKSGHWEKFKNELFKIKTREGHELAMKPMNCPHHTQIYASQKRSYRDLPIRYSEVTAVYRDEQSGELSGLSRVRMITQDDAHVFCRIQQVEDECFKVWDIVDSFYKPFKMPMVVRFSRHDPKDFSPYLGTPEIWKAAESQLKKVIKKRGVDYIDGPGEAAMYGPKIDFIAKDSLGREWQLATIQLDFNLPERFNLTCTNEKGENERIVMIHRAILGSVERFMSVLLEHYAGALPLWLSPVQAQILPISKKHTDYADRILEELKKSNIRAELPEPNETIGKRIRAGELQKIPYLLVVGDREEDSKTVNVRQRGEKDQATLKLKDLITKLQKDIQSKR